LGRVILPVVVRDCDESSRAVQLEHRISQHTREARYGRSDSTQQHVFGSGSLNDEPADPYVIAGPNGEISLAL
jgi:hypothetical protein